MTIYPDAQKARLIERMLPPENVTVPQLSKEIGIPQDTLYGWRRQARRARDISSAPAGASERWSSEAKFAVVLETAALNEAELGAYCVGLVPEVEVQGGWSFPDCFLSCSEGDR